MWYKEVSGGAGVLSYSFENPLPLHWGGKNHTFEDLCTKCDVNCWLTLLVNTA